jgi:hypothetical protein
VFSDEDEEEEENSDPEEEARGLKPEEHERLYSDLEAVGGPRNCTKKNRKFEAIADSDKKFYGKKGSDRRRKLENRLSYLKNIRAGRYLELLSDAGVVPSVNTLQLAQEEEQVSSATKQTHTATPSSVSSRRPVSSARSNCSTTRVPGASPVSFSRQLFSTSNMGAFDDMPGFPSQYRNHDYGKCLFMAPVFAVGSSIWLTHRFSLCPSPDPCQPQPC